jgi:hypothetical protein
MLRTWFPLGLTLGLWSAGCGGDALPPPKKVEAKKNADGSVDDRTMCNWKGKNTVEVSETAGPGYVLPNVRRVYQPIGEGNDRHKVLRCREVDTNFDSVKDVVRRYTDKGDSLYEEADTNYDGRVDTWLTYSKGHVTESKHDKDGDGNPDVWKYYAQGKLVRVKRDTNKDGKPDIWEIYRDGHLERMGVDIDGDERVDRWDHDSDQKKKYEEADKKKEAEAEKKAEDVRKKEEEEAKKDAAQAEAMEGKSGRKPAHKQPPKPGADKPADKPAEKPAAKAPAKKPPAKK